MEMVSIASYILQVAFCPSSRIWKTNDERNWDKNRYLFCERNEDVNKNFIRLQNSFSVSCKKILIQSDFSDFTFESNEKTCKEHNNFVYPVSDPLYFSAEGSILTSVVFQEMHFYSKVYLDKCDLSKISDIDGSCSFFYQRLS